MDGEGVVPSDFMQILEKLEPHPPTSHFCLWISPTVLQMRRLKLREGQGHKQDRSWARRGEGCPSPPPRCPHVQPLHSGGDWPSLRASVMIWLSAVSWTLGLCSVLLGSDLKS